MIRATSTAVLLLGLSSFCSAQTLINYDNLSFFETPLSIPVGRGTVLFEGAVDIAYQSENDNLAEYDSQQIESYVWYGTQLANDWDVGASYRLNYDTQRSDDTIDELRLFARDQWGLISVGHISTQLYDQARRKIATGLMGIDQDNFTLPLERYGLFYQWASSDTQWLVAVDDEANIEIGIVLNKPIGNIDYKLSLRANSNENEDGDAQSVKESRGLAVVAQITKGRWTIDTQLMMEQVQLLDSVTELDLTSLSAGIHAKFNQLNVSLTAISRDNELSDTESSVSLGLSYDISRGLTFNLGSNIVSTELFPEEFTSYSASLRYQF